MERLQAKWDEGKFVCVGLDSDVAKLPECIKNRWPGSITRLHQLQLFNRAIIDATKDIVCAYKPNAAFYEALGSEGFLALSTTVDYIRQVAPDVLVILDYKRGDIGNTNNGYIAAAFECLEGVDAVTVNPYLGLEAMQPFLDHADRGIIVLCRTSNPGAGEFQDRLVQLTVDEAADWPAERDILNPLLPFYQIVARQVASDWSYNGNCMVVVGATQPAELAAVRAIVGDMPILIPGIGEQGGDLEATVKAGANSKGQGMIINGSRGVIFASKGEDFAEAARDVAQQLHKNINAVLAAA